MYAMFKFFDKIHRQVQGDIKSTFYKNSVFKENRWSFYERYFLWAEGHWVKRTILNCSLLFLAIIALNYAYPSFQRLLPSSLGGLKDIIKYKELLLNNQLTLFIFLSPLIITLISGIYRHRASQGLFLSMFTSYSAFRYTCLNSFTLIIILLIDMQISHWFSVRVQIVSTFAYFIYFIQNIIGAGWILVATYRFFHPISRQTIVLKMGINQAIVDKVKGDLRSGYYGKTYSSNSFLWPKNISFISYSIGQKSQPYYLMLSRSKQFEVLSVNTVILKIAFWLYAGFSRRPTTVIFNPEAVSKITNKIWLFRLSEKPTSIASWLMKKVFFTVDRSAYFNLEKIMSVMFSDVAEAIGKNNRLQFDEQFSELCTQISLLQESCAFINDKGYQDNWFLSSSGWFDLNYTQHVHTESNELMTVALSQLENDGYYAEKLFEFSRAVIGYDVNAVAFQLFKALIYLQEGQFNQLLSYKDKLPNDSNYYENAVKGFIGQWEEWRFSFKAYAVESTKQTIDFKSLHLHVIANMFVNAFKRRDLIASEWLADSFVYWFDQMNDGVGSTYGLELVNVEFFIDKDCLRESKVLQDNINSFHRQGDEGYLLSTAFLHAWFDYRVIVVEL